MWYNFVARVSDWYVKHLDILVVTIVLLALLGITPLFMVYGLVGLCVVLFVLMIYRVVCIPFSVQPGACRDAPALYGPDDEDDDDDDDEDDDENESEDDDKDSSCTLCYADIVSELAYQERAIKDTVEMLRQQVCDKEISYTKITKFLYHTINNSWGEISKLVKLIDEDIDTLDDDADIDSALTVLSLLSEMYIHIRGLAVDALRLTENYSHLDVAHYLDKYASHISPAVVASLSSAQEGYKVALQNQVKFASDVHARLVCLVLSTSTCISTVDLEEFYANATTELRALSGCCDDYEDGVSPDDYIDNKE